MDLSNACRNKLYVMSPSLPRVTPLGATGRCGPSGKEVHRSERSQTQPWCQATVETVTEPQQQPYGVIELCFPLSPRSVFGLDQNRMDKHLQCMLPCAWNTPPRVYTKAFGRRIASVFPRFSEGVQPLRNPQANWFQSSDWSMPSGSPSFTLLYKYKPFSCLDSVNRAPPPWLCPEVAGAASSPALVKALVNEDLWAAAKMDEVVQYLATNNNLNYMSESYIDAFGLDKFK